MIRTPAVRSCLALSITVVLFAAALASGAGDFAARRQGAASQPSEAGKFTPPTDKRATKEVDVKKECGVLADVYKHRTALHFLKNEKEAREAILKTIDPEAADQIKGLVEKDERFNELDYHFVEKIRNCEQRILNRLRARQVPGRRRPRRGREGQELPADGRVREPARHRRPEPEARARAPASSTSDDAMKEGGPAPDGGGAPDPGHRRATRSTRSRRSSGRTASPTTSRRAGSTGAPR